MDIVIQSLQYVMGGQYFWISMGFTTSIAMFIGAGLYNGNLEGVHKSLVSVILYGFMIGTVNIFRIMEILPPSEMMPVYQAYAGITTLFVVTIAWVIGLCLGVQTFKFQKRKKYVHDF